MPRERKSSQPNLPAWKANECPNCGSRFLRPSRPRNSAERLGRLRFLDPVRCMHCNTRFVTKSFNWGDIHFAHCPQCSRMDLNGWTGNSYNPPFWMRWMITMGARRYRCEYCRLNFASFRRRKEIFSFSRWKKRDQRLREAELGAALHDDEYESYEGPVSPDDDDDEYEYVYEDELDDDEYEDEDGDEPEPGKKGDKNKKDRSSGH